MVGNSFFQIASQYFRNNSIFQVESQMNSQRILIKIWFTIQT